MSIPDDPARVAGPGELHSEQPRTNFDDAPEPDATEYAPRPVQPTHPCDKEHTVALYLMPTSGIDLILTFYGENDATYHGECTRLSEPITVKFTRLSHDEGVRIAVEQTFIEERALRLELEQRLERIRDRRRNLQALTHEASPA